MNAKHAVLYYPERPFPNTAILWIEGRGFHSQDLPDPCYTLSDLAAVAYKHWVTHLWVMPSYGEFEPEKSGDVWQFTPYENRRKQMMGVVVRKRGHKGKDLEIIFPQHTAWWGNEKSPGWIQAASAHELLITLHYLEQGLGVTVTGSPGRTGWNFLKTIHPEWVEEIPGIDLRACHFDNTAAHDLIWDRPLLSIERRSTYLHKFDKNAAYPYAASKTAIGVGTPVHKDHGEDALITNDNQPVGVWRCTVRYQGPPNGDMPPVWRKKEGWIAGPIIRLLRASGHVVEVHEGYVFPKKHDVLVKWGKRLWDMRQEFLGAKWISKKCALLARQATKQIANTTIGMTAFREFDDDDEMNRPDIRLQVIARHRELTWHNINKVRIMYGVTPVIVYMDALYYLSSNPDGRACFPELVKREQEFGGYKWEGYVEVTPDVLAMFDSKMSEADRLEFLNAKGWQK